MIDINWSLFRTKFNGREQKSFQNLCYLLFCREFDRPFGIQEYLNQTGIETEPIEVNGEWIGFQAKFYDAKISEKVDDITSSIKKAKNKNPKLTKIYFYLNQTYAESSKKGKKDPDYIIKTQNFAQSLGVKIVWKVPSQIEAQLNLDDKNRALAQYYFSLHEGVIEGINELNEHTLQFLQAIRSEIKFNGNVIKIDRSKILERLRIIFNYSSIVILNGEGGVGKTSLVKDFYNSIKERFPFFVFRSVEFSVTHINTLFKKYGNFTSTDFIAEFEDLPEKYVVIDSAEKISELADKEIFKVFLSTLIQHNWKIILTTRSSYLNDLISHFISFYSFNFQLINLEKIDLYALKNISSKHDFVLPNDEKLLDFLRNPFYLNDYLQIYRHIDMNAVFSDFKNLLWDRIIVNSLHQKNDIDLERERCFLAIAKLRVDSGNFFVNPTECDKPVLTSLRFDEIIVYDNASGGYFISHDIYEEWALDRIIEKAFRTSENNKNFFDILGSSLLIRRAFRNWLSEKLLNNRNDIKRLIEHSFIDAEIENHWKNEILISVLLSDYSEVFFQMFEKELFKDDQKLLSKIIFLLRTACKEIDENRLSLFGLKRKNLIAPDKFFTKPSGLGWDCTINFILVHIKEIGLSKFEEILSLLTDWNNSNHEWLTTRKASQIALYYYEKIYGNKFSYQFKEYKEQLISVILNGASEIKIELAAIFDDVITKKETSDKSKYFNLIKAVLTSSASEVAKALPERVLKLAEIFWFQIPKRQEFGYITLGVEDYFCIAPEYKFNYFPPSAFQTPIVYLLGINNQATIDFILSFINKTVECYVNSSLDEHFVEEVEITLKPGEIITQYLSARLWHTYRDLHISPYLFKSIHMALENWLLQFGKTASPTELENICFYLIKNSKSVSVTAIVVSIVLAFPSKLFNIAKILFCTKEFFSFDKSRMEGDSGMKGFLLGMENQFPDVYGDPLHKIERLQACDNEHRKFSLKDIALNYQLFKQESNDNFEKQRESIWKIWDEHYEKLSLEVELTEKDKEWKLYLEGMDSRKKALMEESDKDSKNSSESSEPPIDFNAEKFRYVALKQWAESRLKGLNVIYEQFPQYEENLQQVISEVQAFCKETESNSEDEEDDDILFNGFTFNRSIPVYACSVLIRDFYDQLTNDEKEFCKNTIIDVATLALTENSYLNQKFNGTKQAITTIPLLLKRFPQEKNSLKALLLKLLFWPYSESKASAMQAIHYYLWDVNFENQGFPIKLENKGANSYFLE